MKLVKPSWEIIEQPSGIEGIYDQIELAGRTAYRSENKIEYTYLDPRTNIVYQPNDIITHTNSGEITEVGCMASTAKYYYEIYPNVLVKHSSTAKPFIDRMIKSGHLSVLEHGTIYLYIKGIDEVDVTKYLFNKYSRVVKGSLDNFYITTNYRVLIENNWLDDLKYLCEPTEFHEKRITVKFILARSTAMEFLRHRKFSFLMESTRYCNYSANKFGNELTFIQPSWYNENKLTIKPNIIHDNEGDLIGEYYFHLTGKEYSYFKPWKITPENNFFASLQFSEVLYLELLKQGWKAEQAREILPNALKCDLIMTGFIEDWQHFFSLRALGTTGKPHPSASELAIPLREEFIKRGYIK